MPSSNTKFVDVMTVYPQRCVLTGYPNSNKQGQALDLGFQIQDYGQVYVSALGMGWIARQFSYISQVESDEAVNVVHEDLRVARARIKELETALSHVPKTIEGVINGIKQLSIDAIGELAGVNHAVDSLPGGVVDEDRITSDSDVVVADDETTG